MVLNLPLKKHVPIVDYISLMADSTDETIHCWLWRMVVYQLVAGVYAQTRLLMTSKTEQSVKKKAY